MRKATLRTAVLSFSKARGYDWKSLNEIFPSIDRAWKASANQFNRVELFRQAELAPVGIIPRLLEFDRIVIPQFSLLHPGICDLMRALRIHFGSGAHFIFHLHGDGTKAAKAFEPISDILRRGDGFVAATEADARAFRLCYPAALTLVAPFPFAEPARPPSASPTSDRFWYCGRISEQKNLHSLLLAFRILRARPGFSESTLAIFGAPDSHGSPNMGVKAARYDHYLRRLCRVLKVESSVQWHGFVPQQRLLQMQRQTNHVLVSASLHSDENFGAAALKSLSLGRRAVLSAWGGHLDLKKHFPAQLRLVPVRVTSRGPFLDPYDFARELARSVGDNAAPARRSHYELATVAERLRKFSEALPSRDERLRRSQLIAAIHRRRLPHLFHGYDDPVARPFFKAYAADCSARRRAGGAIWAPPWVAVSAHKVRVDDPHRGRFQLELGTKANRVIPLYGENGESVLIDRKARRWLLESGWAFAAS